MKALTIWQPWATMIVEGWKPREFRRWAAPASIVGQRIVIHAAKRPMKAGELRAIMDYVTSRDGTLDGIDIKAMDLLERVWRRETELPMAAAIGSATLGTPRPVAPRTREGVKPAYAWPMIDVRKFAEPIPCKGAQGFWEWPL